MPGKIIKIKGIKMTTDEEIRDEMENNSQEVVKNLKEDNNSSPDKKSEENEIEKESLKVLIAYSLGKSRGNQWKIK